MAAINKLLAEIDPDAKQTTVKPEIREQRIYRPESAQSAILEVIRSHAPGGMHHNHIASVYGILTRHKNVTPAEIIENIDIFRENLAPDSGEHGKLDDTLNSLSKTYGMNGGAPTGQKPMPIGDIYIPTWNNRPAALPAVLKLGGTPILTHQNTAALIATPGAGKSSIMEAIGASFLNPDADTLGFEVDSSCRGIIIIDNERTHLDVWNSFYRMCKRTKINEGSAVAGVMFAGLRSVARLGERIKAIEHLLETNPCSLLLIDGAGDLVTDTNDLEQAIESRIWLREITVKFDLSAFVTLHPNPGSNKPRGHQGSEICRESESVLLSKARDDDKKLLTTDFEHGKNRNNPKLTTAYRWSADQMMFVSADYDEVQSGNASGRDLYARRQSEELAADILPGQSSICHKDLVQAIMQRTAKSERTAKDRVADMCGWKIIEKGADGSYRLSG
jgi:hypothetical protein